MPAAVQLRADQRAQILAAVALALVRVAHAPGEPSQSGPSATVIKDNLETLVDMVRHSTSARLQSYLAQILDRVCPTCPVQHVNGYCPERTGGPRPLYYHADAVIPAVADALRGMGDPAFAATHGLNWRWAGRACPPRPPPSPGWKTQP